MYNVELYYTAVGQGIPALYINSVISVIVATGCRVESQYSSLPDHVTMAATKANGCELGKTVASGNLIGSG